MNKNKIMDIVLVLMPLAAVVLSGMPNAVTVYAESGLTTYCSYFTYIEDVPAALCMPFAGISGALVFGMAVMYLVKRTAFWLKGIAVMAFASMTLSVMPIISRSETFLVPNMLVPILMLVVCLMTYGMLQKPAPEEEKKNKAKLLK